MQTKNIVFALFLALVVATCSAALSLKNDLIQELQTKGSAEVFIHFKDQVDFKRMEKNGVEFDSMDHSKRGKLVVSTLKELAKETQAPMIKYLKENNVEFHAFWISNTITVKKATMSLLKSLDNSFANDVASFDLVTKDYLVDSTQPQQSVFSSNKSNNNKATPVEGVKWVKAPEVWAKGYEGTGITVGVIDTGVFLHNDLKNTYRGRESGHDYNWFDALNGRPEPYDDNIHGTHCHGTIGGSSSTKIVGVAPKSEWISCKYLSGSGGGTVANCIKCMEFMLEPHDVNGRNGNSDKRPHLVSNSYGGSHNAAREQALTAMLAGGVEMVYAAGNSGSRCNSIGYPAKYDNAFAVGALNKGSDTIARFSSRGPGLNNGLKPEISAPGAQVESTDNRGGYRSLSGTSMACPHVAGAYALLWNARPDLIRNIKETRRIFAESAKGQESSECSSPQRSPNNVYGYGTINILKSLDQKSTSQIIDDIVNQ